VRGSRPIPYKNAAARSKRNAVRSGNAAAPSRSKDAQSGHTNAPSKNAACARKPSDASPNWKRNSNDCAVNNTNRRTIVR
jgi:hypothetical protein